MLSLSYMLRNFLSNLLDSETVLPLHYLTGLESTDLTGPELTDLLSQLRLQGYATKSACLSLVSRTFVSSVQGHPKLNTIP